MKRLIIALTLVALFVAVSFAEVQDFGAYTVDVPEGWKAMQEENTVGIIKDDNSAAVSITYGATEGASLKEIAENFLKELNGRNLHRIGGNYVFEMTNSSGVDSKCFVSVENDKYGLIVATGAENAPKEVDAIIDSIRDK